MPQPVVGVHVAPASPPASVPASLPASVPASLPASVPASLPASCAASVPESCAASVAASVPPSAVVPVLQAASDAATNRIKDREVVMEASGERFTSAGPARFDAVPVIKEERGPLARRDVRD